MNTKLLFHCCIFTTMMFTFTCAQSSDNKTSISRQHAEYLLNEVITDNKLHNVIDSTYTVIKNEEILIKVIEPILFGIYDKENIEEQKPYKIYDIENYYVVSGSLEKDSFGGTFIIIIDKRNAQILKITHGR